MIFCKGVFSRPLSDWATALNWHVAENIATSLLMIGSPRVVQFSRESGNDLAVHFPPSQSVKRYVTTLSCSCDVLFGSVFLNMDWNFRLWRAALCVFVCVRNSPVCVCVCVCQWGVCQECVTIFYLLGLTIFCRLQCISGIFRSVKDLCSWWESNREWVRNRASDIVW